MSIEIKHKKRNYGFTSMHCSYWRKKRGFKSDYIGAKIQELVNPNRVSIPHKGKLPIKQR